MLSIARSNPRLARRLRAFSHVNIITSISPAFSTTCQNVNSAVYRPATERTLVDFCTACKQTASTLDPGDRKSAPLAIRQANALGVRPASA
jgi:hypothetical protein